MSNQACSSNPAILPKRPYGHKGIELSVVGFGGIVVMNEKQSHANRLVAEAVELMLTASEERTRVHDNQPAMIAGGSI